MIPYKLIRSERKTIAIYVLHNGNVEVRAPLKTPIGYINGFIEKKEEWICEKQKEFSEKKRTVAIDTQVFIFGTPFIIKPAPYPRIENSILYVRDYLVKEDAETLLRELARRIITERTKQISSETGIVPAQVKISRAKTRWGSCGSNGNININWRLIMGDTEMTDYIITHELCHIKYHNHGKNFWNEVEKKFPDYKKIHQKLTVFQKRLSNEGWM